MCWLQSLKDYNYAEKLTLTSADLYDSSEVKGEIYFSSSEWGSTGNLILVKSPVKMPFFVKAALRRD